MKNKFIAAIALLVLSFITAHYAITDGQGNFNGYLSLWYFLVSISSLIGGAILLIISQE